MQAEQSARRITIAANNGIIVSDHDTVRKEAASAMVENLARLAASSSVHLLTTADRVAVSASARTPPHLLSETAAAQYYHHQYRQSEPSAAAAPAFSNAVTCVMFSTIGLGLVNNFCRGGGGHHSFSSMETLNGDNATDAACKALWDAFERGSFWSLVSHSTNTAMNNNGGVAPQVQLAVRLGVPVKLNQPQELMHVDQHRILSQLATLQRQHQSESSMAGSSGNVAMELLHVDLSVGGLWAPQSYSTTTSSSSSSSLQRQQQRGTLAVVASVSVLQQQPPPQPQAFSTSPQVPPQRTPSSVSFLQGNGSASPTSVTSSPPRAFSASPQVQPQMAPSSLTSPHGNGSASPTSVTSSLAHRLSPRARISERAAAQQAQAVMAGATWQEAAAMPATLAAFGAASSTSTAPRFVLDAVESVSQGRHVASEEEEDDETSSPLPPRETTQQRQQCSRDLLLHRSSSMDVLAHVSAELRDQQQQQEEQEAAAAAAAAAMEQQQQALPRTPEAVTTAVTQVSSSSSNTNIATLAAESDTNNNNNKTAVAMPYGDKYGNNTNYKKLPPGKTPKNNKRLFVKHSYQDHSKEVPLPAELEGPALTSASASGAAAAAKTVNAAFPLKLHETLSEIERDGHDDIIGWLPHGRSFKIHKQQEFVQLILPKYFVMTKKSSFLRQLNLYGFNRLSGVGPNQASYYHEKFLRGMKFLCRRMQRIKVNGNRIRAAGNPDEEPDLSSFPTCPSTDKSVAQEARPSSPAVVSATHHPQHHDFATAAMLRLMAQQHQAAADPESGVGAASHARALSSLLALLPGSASSAETATAESVSSPSPAAVATAAAEYPTAQKSTNNTSFSSTKGSKKRERRSSTGSPQDVAASAKAGRSASMSSSDSTMGKTNNSTSTAGANGAGNNNAIVSFPLKLQRILDKLESEGSDNIVSWLSHGRAFMVHNPDRFVNEVMPLYFNQSKYSSFQRQLHMYNFQRITTGRDKGAYHHPQFQRGNPKLCQSMQRTRVNGKGTRQPGNPQTEPDFYRLSPLPRIPQGRPVEIPTQIAVAFGSSNDVTSEAAAVPFVPFLGSGNRGGRSLLPQQLQQHAPSVSSSATESEDDS